MFTYQKIERKLHKLFTNTAITQNKLLSSVFYSDLLRIIKHTPIHNLHFENIIPHNTHFFQKQTEKC